MFGSEMEIFWGLAGIGMAIFLILAGAGVNVYLRGKGTMYANLQRIEVETSDQIQSSDETQDA